MSEPFRRSSLYVDLIEACKGPGCPVCVLGLSTARRYIDFVLYERVNDPDTRAEWRAARGYCNRHAWLMAAQHVRSLSVAILERAAIQEILDVLAGGLAGGLSQDVVAVLAESNPRGVGRAVQRWLLGRAETHAPSYRARNLADALEPQVVCPVCAQQEALEESALVSLLNDIGDAAMVHAVERSDGLCLPHFRQALAQAQDDAACARLVDLQRAHFERLCDELSEYIHKSTHPHTAERFGGEGDSWLRAIGALAGHKDAR